MQRGGGAKEEFERSVNRRAVRDADREVDKLYKVPFHKHTREPLGVALARALSVDQLPISQRLSNIIKCLRYPNHYE